MSKCGWRPKKNKNGLHRKLVEFSAGLWFHSMVLQSPPPLAMPLWRNPHLIRSFQWSNVPLDFFEFLSTEFAACLKPPSRDNHCKASHPWTQQHYLDGGLRLREWSITLFYPNWLPDCFKLKQKNFTRLIVDWMMRNLFDFSQTRSSASHTMPLELACFWWFDQNEIWLLEVEILLVLLYRQSKRLPAFLKNKQLIIWIKQMNAVIMKSRQKIGY